MHADSSAATDKQWLYEAMRIDKFERGGVEKYLRSKRREVDNSKMDKKVDTIVQG